MAMPQKYTFPASDLTGMAGDTAYSDTDGKQRTNALPEETGVLPNPVYCQIGRTLISIGGDWAIHYFCLMQPPSNNYDAVSIYYDVLGALVFGGALMRSQAYFLSHIPAEASVLVAGGGSGKILEKIARIHSSGLSIVYVEISERMLVSARKRDAGDNRVEFVCAPIENYTTTQTFDVVVTPFLFDNFLPDKAHSVHQKINHVLAQGGLWLYTDFVYRNRRPFWEIFLLGFMYAFFRRTAKVEADRLTDMRPLFSVAYGAADRRTFYAGFMEAVLYRKK